MKHDRIAGPRRATNVSLPAQLIEEARALGISLSSACEAGLAAEVKKARQAKWIEDHRGHFEAWNAWVEENGLPLAEHRLF